MRRNLPGLALFAAAALLMGLMLAAQGCALEDFISLRVPREVSGVTGAPPVITLAQADEEFAKWERHVRDGTEAFSASIQNARERWGLIASVVNLGLSSPELAAGVSALPGGALLLAALTGLGGWLTKRPGEEKRVREEADKSYDQGRADTLSALREIPGGLDVYELARAAIESKKTT